LAATSSIVALAAACVGLVVVSQKSREKREAAKAARIAAEEAAKKAREEGPETVAQEDKPSVQIEYCCRCKWGLRAAYMAQEILNTFEADLYSVNLAPSMEGGTYKITVLPSNKVIWDRKVDNGFPESKEAKRRLRDFLFPDRELGRCLDCKK